jgi:hypothetical protein
VEQANSGSAIWWDWDGVELDERMLRISDLLALESSQATAQEAELVGTLAVDEMPSLPGDGLAGPGPFLEDLADGEHFAFDMEDLQWLDAV